MTSQLNRNLSIPSKARVSDQPPDWKFTYRKRKWEPVFLAFIDKRLVKQIVNV